jgi:hypothetical protein
VVGRKVTVAVQLWPAIKVAGQLFVIGKSARLEVTEVTVIDAKPMLLSMVVSGGLAVPTSSVGKARVMGVAADTAAFLVTFIVATPCGEFKSPKPLPITPSTI